MVYGILHLIAFLWTYVDQPWNYAYDAAKRFVEKHTTALNILIGTLIILLLAHRVVDLPQIKNQLLWDQVLFLAIPIYLVVFYSRFSDISEYIHYQRKSLANDIHNFRKDAYVYVWEETKYYPFVKREHLTPCSYAQSTYNVLKELEKCDG